MAGLMVFGACGGRAGVGAEPPERPRLRQGVDHDPPKGHSTAQDLKTFAYATSDVTALATEVTGVAAPGGASTVHYEAVELLDDARRLDRMATAARKRLAKLAPSDPALVDARRAGISAYSLTADYARLLIDLANADKDDDLALLNSVANDALALEGTSAELTAHYTDLLANLRRWARAHPEAAAKARATYGR